MGFSRRTFLTAVAGASALRPMSGGPAAADDDPLGVRRDFPVAEKGIYLNSPYITPSPRPVNEAVRRFQEAKGESPVSLGRMLEETDRSRRRFARLVGAGEPEIGMLFATSEGENIVARALDLKAGDNVVIDDLHYETTFVLYRHLARTRGIELRIVPNRQGGAGPADFAPWVDQRTRLISVAWVSHQNGFRHDLRGLADLAHRHGAFLYTDAIQGVGMLSLDVKASGVDFLTAGTYKWLLGGYGVAPFYVREDLLDRITLDRMGSLHIAEDLGNHNYRLYRDARKYGYATLAFGAVYQLTAALDYLLTVGVDRIEEHTVALAHRIHSGLTRQGYRVRTPAGNRSAIVAFAHGLPEDRIRGALEEARISVSFREEGKQIRVGPALFNNGTDIDGFLQLTAGLAG